ncbi:MAG: hypothetical protein IJ874_09940 [Ruminococcus sp.]|nr:hypothetical protein [Ruminococcus sp.]
MKKAIILSLLTVMVLCSCGDTSDLSMKKFEGEELNSSVTAYGTPKMVDDADAYVASFEYVPSEELLDEEGEMRDFYYDVMDFSEEHNIFQLEAPAKSPASLRPVRKALVTEDGGIYQLNSYTYYVIDKTDNRIVGSNSISRHADMPGFNYTGGSGGSAALNEVLEKGRVALFIDENLHSYAIYEDNTVVPATVNGVRYTGRELTFDEVAQFDNVIDSSIVYDIIFDCEKEKWLEMPAD